MTCVLCQSVWVGKGSVKEYGLNLLIRKYKGKR